MEEYTTRELYLMLKGVRDDVKTIIRKQDTTNGRIRRLELWRSALFGGWIVVTIFILPIVINLINNFFSK